MNIIYCLILGFGIGFSVLPSAFAQMEMAPGKHHPIKLPEKIADHQPLTKSGPGQGNQVQFLWDVRFSFDPSEQAGLQGWTGVVYAKGKFFCSKWNGADTLAVFDSTGNFLDIAVIPGIGTVRGMTFDGTNIWAGNNTRFVQVINPETYTKVRQCTVATTVGNVRWITFNPSGNNGAGSFFVGNFNTAIFQVRKPPGTTVNMASINSIPASTHGLSGMYGVAYEDLGAESKFWVFDQNQTATSSQAVIIQLNTQGNQTGKSRNVNLDGPSGAAGLAGGIFLADLSNFESKTLVCLNQGVGVFGYDTRLAPYDASFDSLATSNGYVAWPKNWSLGTSFKGKIRATGLNTLTGVSPMVKITNAETMEIAQELLIDTLSIQAGQLASFESPVFNPDLLDANILYQSMGIVDYPNDLVPKNDSAFSVFMLTDSTVSRDLLYFAPALASSLGIGAAASEEKGLGTRFELPLPDTLTSVSYFLNAPFEGESSSVSIYAFEGNVPSIDPIVTTTSTYTATTDDNTDGVFVTLKLDEPLALPAGNFLVAVNELGDSSCGIGSFAVNFMPGTYFVKWTSNNAGQWSDLSSFPSGLRRTIAIYPNFGRRAFVTGNAKQNITESLNIYPNPATDKLFINGTVKGEFSIRITDLSGRTLISANSTAEYLSNKNPVMVNQLSPGTYLMEIVSAEFRSTKKFVKK